MLTVSTPTANFLHYKTLLCRHETFPLSLLPCFADGYACSLETFPVTFFFSFFIYSKTDELAQLLMWQWTALIFLVVLCGRDNKCLLRKSAGDIVGNI